MYTIDPVQYGQLIGDIARLKEDVKTGNITISELSRRLDELEDRANRNDEQHREFAEGMKALPAMAQSLKKIEDGTFYVDKKVASKHGVGWIGLIAGNPKYLMWAIIGVVSALMVLMGYSVTEIMNVLEKLQ